MGWIVGRGRWLLVVGAAVVVVLGTIASPIKPAASAGNTVACPTENLQTAIDNAAAGSTIRITGTCTGRFRIDGKDLTLVGPAVLDAAKVGSVLTVSLSNLTLKSLTIQNGSGAHGGGIDFSTFHTLTLDNVTVSGNSAQLGGGIFNDAATKPAIIRNSVVSGNTAKDKGGGIWAGAVDLDRSTVTNNSAGGNGGGIWAGIEVTVGSSTVTNNSAANGAGMYGVPDQTKVTIDKSTFSGNKPDQCRC